MMCGEAKELMTAARFGEIEPVDDAQGFQQHLESCAECRADMAALSGLWQRLADLPVPEPSRALDARWHATLDSLISQGRKPGWRTVFQTWTLANLWPRSPGWQAAIALACLVVGILVGTNFPRQNENPEIAKLHQEIATTRDMVALSLLQQQSATERLRGVNYTGSMRTMEPEVLSALIGAVAHDPSVNVRLAAVDALSKASSNPGVLQSLTQSLPGQDSPMVQAALIDYLVDAHDRRALGTLRQLAAQPDLNPAVLERAHFAVQQLSR